MPKLKIFLWQLCHASLPTKDTLCKRGMNLDPRYPFCQTEKKDVDHLFFHCQISQECWRLTVSHNWIDHKFVSGTQNNILQRLSSARTTTPAIRIDRVVSLIWSIWKIRNNMVFRSETPIPENTLIRVKKVNSEWRIRYKRTNPLHTPIPNQSSGNHKKTHLVVWRKP